MAWLAGNVQGVVVQITAKHSPEISGSLKAFAKAALSLNKYFTSMAGETLSLYSTSASASDEPQSKQNCTGFEPRYK